jgi:hypothetical protein
MLQGNMLEIIPQAGKGTDMVQSNHIADPSDTNRGILWAGLDDDDGSGLDINILLSEFGEFGGFFEKDLMDFGEVSEIFLLSCPSLRFYWELHLQLQFSVQVKFWQITTDQVMFEIDKALFS